MVKQVESFIGAVPYRISFGLYLLVDKGNNECVNKVCDNSCINMSELILNIAISTHFDLVVIVTAMLFLCLHLALRIMTL